MLVVFVRGWPRGGATLKHINHEKINMEINDKLFLKYKFDYLELSLEISKLRYDGEEVPVDLLLQTLEVGCLADIPEDELSNLLFNLDIQ